MSFNGAVNFLKPPGMTSSDAVVWLRWVLGTKKCGHGGTLDPAACGVLPVLVGKGTRLFDRFLEHEKTYTATMRFGVLTDTLDAQGKVLKRCDYVPTEAELAKAIESFKGEITQTPPQYSAIKVGGVKAYDAARSGKPIELPERKVHIYSISEPRFIEKDLATLTISCSSGTYIRTLCSDIAESCGSLASLEALTRQKSGMFEIENALSVQELLQMKQDGTLEQAVSPIDSLLSDLPEATVKSEAEKFAINGAPLKAEQIAFDPIVGAQYRLKNQAGQLIGVFEWQDKLYPRLML